MRSNVASQNIPSQGGFTLAHHIPHSNGENVGITLNDFIHQFYIHEHLTYDGTAVQMGLITRFVDTIRQNHIQTHVWAPRKPNKNPAGAATM